MAVKTKKRLAEKTKAAILEGEMDTISIEKIKLWKKNPRINDKAVKKLAKLIRKHGQVSPVVAWSKDGRIYKGNTTYKALRHLGADQIRVLWVDFPNKKAAVSFALADNKSSEWTDWDPEILATLMQDEALELGEETGFTEKELKGLKLSTNTMPDGLPSVNIQGTVTGKDDFIVIQFKDKAELTKFKKRMDGLFTASRMLKYTDMMKRLRWRKG